MTESIKTIIKNIKNPLLQSIAKKIIHEQRVTNEEGILLFEQGELSWLGALANEVKEKKFGRKVFFNKNFHIEPTNICIYSCKFCAYSSSYAHKSPDAWQYSIAEMMDIVKKYDDKDVTEVHIVGGVHPKMDLYFFVDLLQQIKNYRPKLVIKGFTAVELAYMFKKANLTTEQGLKIIKEAGLDSIPGGGSEIFDHEIRAKICGDKVSTEGWIEVHQIAHQLDIPTNATILYGHIESYKNRIEHMELLRNLQDKTQGFNCFIPLKFRNKNNEMSHIEECSIIEDLKMFAISRLFLDNIPHLKAYWPMIGRDNAQLSLSFGVDDLDGTIDDTTKIYSMAGAEEVHPFMSTEQIIHLISIVGNQPVERDTFYNEVNLYM
ncbi:MAG: CofH family radical SAM protein [Chitinophagaceae bacterium]